MLNLGTGEVLVIALVALIVLGPTKLPQVAKQIGNMLGEFKRMSQGFQSEFRDAMNEVQEPITKTRSAVMEAVSIPTVGDAGEVAALESSDADDQESEPASNTNTSVPPDPVAPVDDAPVSEDGPESAAS